MLIHIQQPRRTALLLQLDGTLPNLADPPGNLYQCDREYNAKREGLFSMRGSGRRALWECGNRGAISKGGGKGGKPGVRFSRLSTDRHFHRASGYAAVIHAAGVGGR